MAKQKILVAHERLVIARAIRQVLAAQGLEAEVVVDGDAIARALQLASWDGLVVDVGLPGPPVHQLVALAKTGVPTPVQAVVLIASVFRRTSYKRRPQQLYGADDYVEVHMLGAELPSKLWRWLSPDVAGPDGMLEAEALLTHLQEIEDGEDDDAAAAAADARLALLLVADAVLYSGDKLADAETPAATHAALAAEMQAVRELHRGVAANSAATAAPPAPSDRDPVAAALDHLMRDIDAEPRSAWS